MILRITFKKYGYITGLVFLSFFICGITFGMDDQRSHEDPRPLGLKKKPAVSLLGLPQEPSPRTSPRRDEGMKGFGVSSLLVQPSPRQNSPHQASSCQSSPRRSSPRPESPRRSPRPRSSSHLSPEPTSFGIQMIRAITPRKLRPNDSIWEQFESMHTPKSSKKQDLRRLKFYQEFTDQKNTTGLVKKYKGGKNTTEILLDKFWDFPVTELISADAIEKIESKPLEIIGSSAIFLINNINEDLVSDLEALSKVVCDIYSTLLTRLKGKEGEKENRTTTNEDATKELSSEDCYYYMAKYSTLLKSYTVAWSYLGFCSGLLTWEDREELRWLKLLRDGYVGYLKQGPIVDSPKYKVYFEAARFSQKVKDNVNVLANSKDKEVDDDVVGLCFMGVKDLYASNLTVEQKLDEVNKLTTCVRFPLGCTAYHAAKQEEAIAERLLTITRDCFGLLGPKMARYNFMVIADDILIDKRFKFLPSQDSQPQDSRSLKAIKADILAQVGSVVWQKDKDKSKALYFEAAKILYHANPKRSCLVWNSDVLEVVLGCTMDLNPEIVSPVVWESMVGGMSQALVYRKYPSIIYLPVLRYYAGKEMWVTAQNLAQLVTQSKLMPSSHAVEWQYLAEGILGEYKKVQGLKKSMGIDFQNLITFIINHKAKPNSQVDELEEQWVGRGIMTKIQWENLIKTDKKYLESASKVLCNNCESSSPTFTNLEIEAYLDELKDMIGLAKSPVTKIGNIS